MRNKHLGQKIILITIAALALMAQNVAYAQEKPKAKIKSIREILYNSKMKIIESYLKFYSLDGNCVEDYRYRDSADVRKQTYKYETIILKNDTINLVTEYCKYENGELTDKTETKYNKATNTIERKNYYNNDWKRKTIWRYDNDGKLKEEQELSMSDEIFTKKIYNRDEKGNVVEILVYTQVSTFNKLGNKQILKYNDKNQLIDHLTYRGDDGSLYNEILYEYDEKGRVSKEDYLKQDYLKIRCITYKYDKYDNVIEDHQQYPNGDLEDNTRITNYKYDEHGNWIEEKYSVKYDNDKNKERRHSTTRKRTIEYY